MNFKKLIDYINNHSSKKNLYNLVIVFLIGVLLLIITNFFSSTTGTASEPTNASVEQSIQLTNAEYANYEANKRKELENILSQMQGVGRVQVMIHFSSGEELVPAINIQQGQSSTTERDTEGGERRTIQDNNGTNVVITNKGSNTEALILKRVYPKITGVVVVAEGAEDNQVRLQIISSITKLFELPANKVDVYPMKK
jgi:stage III sporulation protein AG